MNVVAFLKGNVEVGRAEDLPQFLLDGSEDLVLIKLRTDDLSDLGQQPVFLCAPLRVMHDDVIFQRQSYLQRESNQHSQVRRSEHAPFGMGKQNDSEVVLARLQAHRGDFADAFLGEHPPELLKPAAGECRQRFRHVGHVAKTYESATAISELANVFAPAALLQPVYKL